MNSLKEFKQDAGRLKDVDIREVDLDSLVDLRDVQIDMELPKEKRIEEFLRQIKNPYCFKVGKIAVKVEFSEEGPSFEDRVKEYLESL